MRALSRPVPLTALLLAGALVAWIITVERMRGMDAGPGTDLGGIGWYVGIWATMMAAMMLPSTAPMVLMFARVAQSRRDTSGFVPTWVFVAGYLAAWTAYGLLTYGIFRVFVSAGTDYLAWDRNGRFVAGGALVAAGLYELTPLKDLCLRHCRGPLHFVFHRWRPGRVGAFRMGVEHGAVCVGCCWGLMLALFALGVMSLFWMAVIGVVIFAEKLAPQGERLARVVALCLIGLGIWVAAAPASVPGLVQPDSHGADIARLRMMHMKPDAGMSPAHMNPGKESRMNQAPAMPKRPAMGMPSP